MDLKAKSYYDEKNEILMPETLTVGRGCFRVFYNQHFKDAIKYYIKKRYDREITKNSDLINEVVLIDLVTIYEEDYFRTYQDDLGHYFRHLYHMVRMVDRADIGNKDDYTRIIRAQMSTYESIMLFYNGLSKYSKEFKPFITKYALLKGLDFNLLINKNADKYSSDSYTKDAFGE